MNHQPNPSHLKTVAIQAALRAGDIIRKNFGTNFSIETKANQYDLVTNVDRQAEGVIIDTIRKSYPEHGFLAEESEESISSSNVKWIIDPIDGTMNFVHSIPLFAVSIAATVNDVLQVAVIYQPMTHELFTAEKGKGAYLNNTLLKSSSTSLIQDAIAATGLPTGIIAGVPYESDKILKSPRSREDLVAQFIQFLELGTPIRQIGSAVLSLAYVAAGRLDFFWANNLKPWDVAAGQLIVEEAGGFLSHFNGTPYNMFQYEDVLASNKILHAQILHYLK